MEEVLKITGGEFAVRIVGTAVAVAVLDFGFGEEEVAALDAFEAGGVVDVPVAEAGAGEVGALEIRKSARERLHPVKSRPFTFSFWKSFPRYEVIQARTISIARRVPARVRYKIPL